MRIDFVFAIVATHNTLSASKVNINFFTIPPNHSHKMSRKV